MLANEKYNDYLRVIKDLPYVEYLKTDHWSNFRKQCLEQNKECCLCGSAESLRVHHKCYDNKGKETFRDVVVLCDYCHNKTHLVVKEKNTDIEKMEIIFLTLVYFMGTTRIDCESVYKFEDKKIIKIISDAEIEQEARLLLQCFTYCIRDIIGDDIRDKKLKNASAYTIKNFNPHMYINDLEKEGVLYGILNSKFYTDDLNILLQEICKNSYIYLNNKINSALDNVIERYEKLGEKEKSDFRYECSRRYFKFEGKDLFLSSIETVTNNNIKEIINKTLEYEDKHILFKKVVLSLNDYYHKDIKSKQEKALNELL